MMAEKLGFEPSETAFIGDSDVDVYTAKNAKMTSVACTWGFRSREQLEACVPDYIIDNPTDILAIFE
jgi:phosphoglycolate phosphatase-like HAD superfamily hydrolase